MRAAVFCALASGVAVDAAVFNKGQAFLSSDMQPELVARTIVKVEDEWRAEAASFAECNETLSADADVTAECGSATAAFQKSCATVVDAIVRASSGERSRVQEYMGIVCGEATLSGWHQARCGEFASSVVEAMADDDYENREGFAPAKSCTVFWSRFAVEERARVDQERAEREAAEKKAEDERIQAEQEAAARAAEEQKRREKEEAEEHARETKRQAEEAAEKLKTQREEAERQAEEAKRKMEEAKAVAEEAAARHREMLARAANATLNGSAAVNATSASQNASQAASIPQNATASKNASAPVNSSK